MKSLEAIDFGEMRQTLVKHCAAGAHVDALLALEDLGRPVEEVLGLWEYLERQMSQAGEHVLAEAVRGRLAQAGHFNPQMAVADAKAALERGDPWLSERILRATFRDADLPDEARKIIASALMTSSKDAARAHLAELGASDPEAALAEIDLLRGDDLLLEAEVLCERYRDAHPGDIRFLVRQARIKAALFKWDAALALWGALGDQPGFPRSAALANRIRILARRDQWDEAHALTAAFLLQGPSLPDLVGIAETLGLRHLASAALARAVETRGDGAVVSDRDWSSLCETLLDVGELGLVAWLAGQGVPVGATAEQALDAGARVLGAGFEAIADQAEAAKWTSPDCLLPFPSFMRMRRPSVQQNLADARFLLVNASLASGGAERQFVALVKALLAQGVAPAQIDLAFFSLSADRGRGHFLADLEQTGVRVHDLQAYDGQYDRMTRNFEDQCLLLPKPLRGDVVALHHLAKRLQPTVIHGWQDRAALAAGLVGATLGVERIVMSARNMQPQNREPGARSHGRGLLAAISRLPNAQLTANARAGVRDYGDWLDLAPGEVQFLGNGLDLTKIPFLAKANRPEPDTTVRITGVFRLAANKRPLLWLDTVAALRARGTCVVKPRIVGVGPLLQDVAKRAAELGLDDLIMDSNLVTPQDIYGDSDVVLLMSRVEGTPNVLLEAQAMGIAVAACDVGGVRDAVVQRGEARGLILAADVDPAEAAAQIDAWLPGALAAPRESRRRFIEDDYSFDTLGRRALQYYKVSGGA